MKRQQIQIQLTDSDREWVEAARQSARAQGEREHRRVSLSEWVRDACRRKLATTTAVPVVESCD